MDNAVIISSAVTVVAVVLVALIGYIVLFRVGLRGLTAQDLREHVQWPARAVVALVAALLAVPATDLLPVPPAARARRCRGGGVT